MASLRNSLKIFRTNSKANILENQPTTFCPNKLNHSPIECNREIPGAAILQIREKIQTNMEEDNKEKSVDRYDGGFIIMTIKMAANRLDGLFNTAISNEQLKSLHLIKEMRNSQTSLQKLMKSFSILWKPLEEKPLSLLEKALTLHFTRTDRTLSLKMLHGTKTDLNLCTADKHNKQNYSVIRRKNVFYVVRNVNKETHKPIKVRSFKECVKKVRESYKIKMKSLLKLITPLSVGCSSYIQKQFYSSDEEKRITISVKNTVNKKVENDTENGSEDLINECNSTSKQDEITTKTGEFKLQKQYKVTINYLSHLPGSKKETNVIALPHKSYSEQLLSDIVKNVERHGRYEGLPAMNKGQLLTTTLKLNNNQLRRCNSVSSLTANSSNNTVISAFCTPDLKQTTELINTTKNFSFNKVNNLLNNNRFNNLACGFPPSGDTDFNKLQYYNNDVKLIDNQTTLKEEQDGVTEWEPRLRNVMNESGDNACASKAFITKPIGGLMKQPDNIRTMKDQSTETEETTSEEGNRPSEHLIKVQTTQSTKRELLNEGDQHRLNVVHSLHKNSCDVDEYLSRVNCQENKFPQCVNDIFIQDGSHYNNVLSDIRTQEHTTKTTNTRNAEDSKEKKELHSDYQKSIYSPTNHTDKEPKYQSASFEIKGGMQQSDRLQNHSDVGRNGEHVDKEDNNLIRRILANKVSWNDLDQQEMLYKKLLNNGNETNSIYRLDRNNYYAVKYEENKVVVLQDMMQCMNDEQKTIMKKFDVFNKPYTPNKSQRLEENNEETGVEIVKQKINRIPNPLTMAGVNQNEMLRRRVGRKNDKDVSKDEISMMKSEGETHSGRLFKGGKEESSFSEVAALNPSSGFKTNFNYPEPFRNDHLKDRRLSKTIYTINNRPIQRKPDMFDTNRKSDKNNSEYVKSLSKLQNITENVVDMTLPIKQELYSPKIMSNKKSKKTNKIVFPTNMENVEYSSYNWHRLHEMQNTRFKRNQKDSSDNKISLKADPSRIPRRDVNLQRKANIEYNDENITVEILHNESTVIKKVFPMPPEIGNERANGHKKEQTSHPLKTVTSASTYEEFLKKRSRKPIEMSQNKNSSISFNKSRDQYSYQNMESPLKLQDRKRFVKNTIFPDKPTMKLNYMNVQPGMEQNVNRPKMSMVNSVKTPFKIANNVEQSKIPLQNPMISYKKSNHRLPTSPWKMKNINEVRYNPLGKHYNFKLKPAPLKQKAPFKFQSSEISFINTTNAEKRKSMYRWNGEYRYKTGYANNKNQYNNQFVKLPSNSAEVIYNTKNKSSQLEFKNNRKEMSTSNSNSRLSELSSERLNMLKLLDSSSKLKELYIKKSNLVVDDSKGNGIKVVSRHMYVDNTEPKRALSVGQLTTAMKEAPFRNRVPQTGPLTKVYPNEIMPSPKFENDQRGDPRFKSFYKQLNSHVNEFNNENYKRSLSLNKVGKLQKRIDDHKDRLLNTKLNLNTIEKDKEHYDFSVKINRNDKTQKKIVESTNLLKLKKQQYGKAIPFGTRINDGNNTRKKLFNQFHERIKDMNNRMYADKRDHKIRIVQKQDEQEYRRSVSIDWRKPQTKQNIVGSTNELELKNMVTTKRKPLSDNTKHSITENKFINENLVVDADGGQRYKSRHENKESWLKEDIKEEEEEDLGEVLSQLSTIMTGNLSSLRTIPNAAGFKNRKKSRSNISEILDNVKNRACKLLASTINF